MSGECETGAPCGTSASAGASGSAAFAAAASAASAALAALLFAGGYGYDMRKTILEKTGGAVDVDVGGLYRSLRRLEEEGAVVSRWCDDEAASGPRRREYELTQQGVELAEQWLDVLRERQRLDELLAGLLEDGLSEAGRRGPAG